jgi:hypothetical protein
MEIEITATIDYDFEKAQFYLAQFDVRSNHGSTTDTTDTTSTTNTTGSPGSSANASVPVSDPYLSIGKRNDRGKKTPKRGIKVVQS